VSEEACFAATADAPKPGGERRHSAVHVIAADPPCDFPLPKDSLLLLVDLHSFLCNRSPQLFVSFVTHIRRIGKDVKDDISRMFELNWSN
jgi:hypothetical protein